MKKIIIVSSICLALFSSNLFSQTELRNLVCVVRPIVLEETRTLLAEYATQLFREGFTASGRHIRGLTLEGFGSGFIIKHGDEFYILTNEHVVRHADSVILEFQVDTGTQKFRSVVLARNSDWDLALIKFPAEKEVNYSFDFLEPVPRDGTEVWSAGFPGLGGVPTWQLGHGIISNRNVTAHQYISSIIQHTAQVHGGNSGGPLLVRNPESRVGYDVIAVNTWRVLHRQGTNFSVPTTYVRRFLDSVDITQVATTLDEDRATERMRAFASIVNSRTTSYKDILPFVSMDYVLSVPASIFVDFLRSASRDASTTARDHFRNVEPFEAFRVIIADAIWQRRGRPLDFENLAVGGLTESIQGNFSDNRGRPVTSEWRYENGDFFMVNFSGLPITEGIGIRGTYEGNRGIFVRATTPRHDYQSAGFEFGFTRFHTPHFGFLHTFGFNLINVPEIRRPTDPDDFPFQRGQRGVTVEGRPYNPFAQLPIAVGNYFVIPYIVADFGVGIGTIIHAFVGGTAGARFVLPVGSRGNRKLYLGLEYSFRRQASLVDVRVAYIDEQLRETTKELPVPRNLGTFGLRFGFEF